MHACECQLQQVAVHLFETCIIESLVQRGKAVVLATHQLQCLPKADLVVVLDADGVQVCYYSYIVPANITYTIRKRTAQVDSELVSL
jgi:energy-coupling factor transporter ATP-binding protein EcfA2